MAERTFRISDLSGDIIKDDDQHVSVIVYDHPQIEEPITLDATTEEVKGVGNGKDYAVLELVSDGGDTRERVVLELAEFDKLFKADVDDALANAQKYELVPSHREPAQPEEPKRRGPGRPASTAGQKPKVDYTLPENYGLKHRGIANEEEQRLVRDNFDQANANRKREGQPEIDLNNPKDVKRYGLQDLAAKKGVELTPEFKA